MPTYTLVLVLGTHRFAQAVSASYARGTHLAPGSASLGDPDTELPFAEPISEEAREFVQPLIDLFGDNWARCWSSPQWQLLKDQFWLSSSGCARVLKCLKMIFGFI